MVRMVLRTVPEVGERILALRSRLDQADFMEEMAMAAGLDG